MSSFRYMHDPRWPHPTPKDWMDLAGLAANFRHRCAAALGVEMAGRTAGPLPAPYAMSSAGDIYFLETDRDPVLLSLHNSEGVRWRAVALSLYGDPYAPPEPVPTQETP